MPGHRELSAKFIRISLLAIAEGPVTPVCTGGFIAHTILCVHVSEPTLPVCLCKLHYIGVQPAYGLVNTGGRHPLLG